MNITQRQQILDLTEKIEKFDLVGFMKSQGIEDLLQHQYGDRPFLEFSQQIHKMYNQLRSEIEGKDFKYIPVTFNSATEFGNINLTQDLSELLSSLKVHGNETNVLQILDKLIFFQIAFGFWDRSSIKVHDVRAIDLKRKLNEFNLLEVRFKSQSENIEKNILIVQDLIEKLNIGLSQLNTNATEISTIKQESDASYTLIKRNLEDSDTTKTQITLLQTKITEALNKISTDINENSTKFTEISNQNNKLKAELEKTIEDSKNHNNEINNTYKYIDSKKDQIEKMVGLATDGAIGYKFDERQKSIFKSILFWKIAVPLSYILAAFWVVLVFTVFKAKFENEWLNLSINLIKTTPAWFLVAFCTNQYKKERDFEEEYAFKSAMAMTITSYTSLLSNDDADKMKTKDKVLSKVLDNLYASPLHKETEHKSITMRRNKITSDASSKAKELEEILKPVIELMKEIKK